MQKRHKNKQQYFEEQAITTKKFIIPYLSKLVGWTPETRVLEIGCGEAGNLKPFLEAGCKATGIDISCGRIEWAKRFYQKHPNRNNLTLICKDIYEVEPSSGEYDLILMRDVIEHIPQQEKFMGFVKQFMKPGGIFFLAFPLGKILLEDINKFAGILSFQKCHLFICFPNFFMNSSSKFSGKTEKKLKACCS